MNTDTHSNEEIANIVQKMAPSVNNIVEVIFGEYNTSELFLAKWPQAKIVVFDADSLRNHSFVNDNYPGRYTGIVGNVYKTIPEYILQHPSSLFDLIHIHFVGNHSILRKILAILSLVSTSSAIICIHNCTEEPIHVWKDYVADGTIVELEDIKCSSLYCGKYSISNIEKRAIKEALKPIRNDLDSNDVNFQQFEIKNNVVSMVPIRPRYHYRAPLMKKFLEDTCAKSKHPINTTIPVGLYDQPAKTNGVCSFSSRNAMDRNIMIPDFYAIINYNNRLEYKDAKKFEQKRKEALFIGVSSGNLFAMWNDRLRMCKKYKFHEKIHCYISDIIQLSEEELCKDHAGYKDYLHPAMSIEEQLDYKFLINIDGNTCAWDRLVWILNSNSVCLKKKSDKKCWYYDLLENGKHYIEIDENSDIEKIMDSYSDEQCKEITKNANLFVKEYLQYETQTQYMSCVLKHCSSSVDWIVILKGHYRTFDTTHTSWDTSLSGCNYKMYLHTWDKQNSESSSWHDPGKSSQPLTETQIQLLKSYDRDIQIENQKWTETEKTANLLINTPFKSYLFYWQSIFSCLNRIQEESKYILICRYDIQINIDLKTIQCEEGEIIIGYSHSANNNFPFGMSDILYCIHYKDKHKLQSIPEMLYQWKENPSKYQLPEDYFSDFILTNWKKVTRKWLHRKDFLLVR